MAEKEEKFIVYNKKDIVLAKITPDQLNILNDIDEAIQLSRSRRGANKFPKYIVCNQDESYAEEVWKIILKGESEKGL